MPVARVLEALDGVAVTDRIRIGRAERQAIASCAFEGDDAAVAHVQTRRARRRVCRVCSARRVGHPGRVAWKSGIADGSIGDGITRGVAIPGAALAPGVDLARVVRRPPEPSVSFESAASAAPSEAETRASIPQLTRATGATSQAVSNSDFIVGITTTERRRGPRRQ